MILMISLIFCSILLDSTEGFLVPGSGCGVSKPVRKLRLSDVGEDLAAIECGQVESEDEFAQVMSKMEAMKCQEDVASCRHAKEHVFISGGIDCAAVAVLQQTPSDPASLECSLLPKAVATDLLANANTRYHWCLSDKIGCYGLEGHTFLEMGIGCSDKNVELVESPQSTWQNKHCLLVSNDVYETERESIRVDWCIDYESQCKNLPSGYGYESGPSCGGAGTPITVVDSAPAGMLVGFDCRIMTPIVFQQLQLSLSLKHKMDSCSCDWDELDTRNLTDKSAWEAKASDVYTEPGREEDFLPPFAIDGIIQQGAYYFYHSAVTSPDGQDWLQVDTVEEHFVTAVFLVTRKDSATAPFYVSNLEARVGNADASVDSPASTPLDINQVCGTSDSNNVAFELKIACTSPVKGRFLTIQKIIAYESNGSFAFFVNEVDIQVIDL